MGPAFTESRTRVVIEMGVRVVTTGRGDPGTPIVQRLKQAGIVVIPVVPSVSHARRVEQEGADAIVASGTEAGGHVGSVATLPLVPQVVDAVRVPVIAAGGIADGRGFLAALALGANGVQLGTRLIASVESEAAPGYKQRVLQAAETDTVVTELLTGKPVRTLATPALRDYEAARLHGAGETSLAELKRAFRRASRSRREEYPAVAGQVSGMVREVRPVREIIEGMLADAAELAAKLVRLAGAAPGREDVGRARNAR
jgi:enoyl-[acyl-carrier protein] reductase II